MNEIELSNIKKEIISILEDGDNYAHVQSQYGDITISEAIPLTLVMTDKIINLFNKYSLKSVV